MGADMGRGEESEIQELPDDFARWGVPVVLAEEAVSAIPTTFARRPNSAQTLLVKSFLFDNGRAATRRCAGSLRARRLAVPHLAAPSRRESD